MSGRIGKRNTVRYVEWAKRAIGDCVTFDMKVRDAVPEPRRLPARLVVRGLQFWGNLTRPFGFKTFKHAARLLGSFLEDGQHCSVRLGQDSRFRFRLSDPYWSPIVCSAFPYEPEIGFLLERIRKRDFAFLDCGANFGYWSVFCSSRQIACPVVIAVEAAASTFRELESNCALNSGRFETRLNAVHSRDGRTVILSERNGNHANASISGNPGTSDGIGVQTITIDTLLSDGSVPADLPVVVKLDVEGSEIEALKGASRLFQRESLIIYEDHGSDPASKVTDFVIRELGLPVFFVDHRRRVTRIRSSPAAGAVKIKPKRGYNFFAATPGSSFDRELNALAGP